MEDLYKPSVGAVAFDRFEGSPTTGKLVKWFAIERIEGDCAFDLEGVSHDLNKCVTDFQLIKLIKEHGLKLPNKDVITVRTLLEEMAYAVHVNDPKRVEDAGAVFDQDPSFLKVAWPQCSPVVRKLVTDYRLAQKAST